MHFPVNGGWGGWGPWASCDAGIKKRNRECNSPAPLNGGAFCAGFSQQSGACPG